jgi:Ribosomal protein L7/L12 C-terminal domain
VTPTPDEGGDFHVVLADAGARLASVMGVVRSATGLGLSDTKNLVDSAPSVVKGRLDRETAEKLATELEKAGARAEVGQGQLAVHEDAMSYERSITAWLDAWLRPTETFEAAMRTTTRGKKDVVFTSERILVAEAPPRPPKPPKTIESIPYESITGFRAEWNWLLKRIALTRVGNTSDVVLFFANEADHDRALDILNRHAN